MSWQNAPDPQPPKPPSNLMDLGKAQLTTLKSIAANTNPPTLLGSLVDRGFQNLVMSFTGAEQLTAKGRYLVPKNYIVLINNITYVLGCSAAVGNRNASIIYDSTDSINAAITDELWISPLSPNMTTPSYWVIFWNLTYDQAQAAFDANNVWRAQLPTVYLLPGSSFYPTLSLGTTYDTADQINVQFQAHIWEIASA